jgi:hypothetical protein
MSKPAGRRRLLSFLPVAAMVAVATPAVAAEPDRIQQLWQECCAAERAASELFRQWALAYRRAERGPDFDALEAAWDSASDAMDAARTRFDGALAALK